MLTKPDSTDLAVARFAPVPDWSLAPRRVDAGNTQRAGIWSSRVEELATRLLEADEALSDPRWRRRQLSPGLRTGPRLLFEDHTEIPMVGQMIYLAGHLCTGDSTGSVVDDTVGGFRAQAIAVWVGLEIGQFACYDNGESEL